MGFRVNEVIKHGTSGWKLDCLEFSYPPLGELNSVVNKLSKVQMYIILVSNIAVIVNSTVAFVCGPTIDGIIVLEVIPQILRIEHISLFRVPIKSSAFI